MVILVGAIVRSLYCSHLTHVCFLHAMPRSYDLFVTSPATGYPDTPRVSK